MILPHHRLHESFLAHFAKYDMTDKWENLRAQQAIIGREIEVIKNFCFAQHKDNLTPLELLESLPSATSNEIAFLPKYKVGERKEISWMRMEHFRTPEGLVPLIVIRFYEFGECPMDYFKLL